MVLLWNVLTYASLDAAAILAEEEEGGGVDNTTNADASAYAAHTPVQYPHTRTQVRPSSHSAPL